ncbi:hypothetical protein M0804_003819 [Polistes exclamans]|nr:hypothetical protein M0804_003819 [Polistes exclamans]
MGSTILADQQQRQRRVDVGALLLVLVLVLVMDGSSAAWATVQVFGHIKLDLEKLAQEKTEMQRHYVMYYEMSYGLNVEMHKQVSSLKIPKVIFLKGKHSDMDQFRSPYNFINRDARACVTSDE